MKETSQNAILCFHGGESLDRWNTVRFDSPRTPFVLSGGGILTSRLGGLSFLFLRVLQNQSTSSSHFVMRGTPPGEAPRSLLMLFIPNVP